MRPIYRAWDKKYKVMLGGFAIYYEGDHIGMSYDDAKQYFTEEQLENDEGAHFSSVDDWVLILNDFELMQCPGIKDKNGELVYEGDIIKWYILDIEYQTHYGNNIPLGSYTEPCGVKETKMIKPVVFHETGFTTMPFIYDPEEDEPNYPGPCPMSNHINYDRKELNNIFYPRPYGRTEVLSDEEFLEVAKDISNSLDFEITSIEDFIEKINGFEVIGNHFEHPELITHPTVK